MYFFEELKELRKFIIACLAVFISFTALFFLFPLQKSFSMHFLEQIKNDLVPAGVSLITTNPMDAFMSQIMVSFFLALAISSPFFLYRTIKYLTPALYEKESRAIFKILVPSSVLFLLGCAFGYFLLIPSTFKILYSFSLTMGVQSFFGIKDFITTVLVFMMVSGVLFLLPVFMVLLSRFGLIEAGFWRKNWRNAAFSIAVFSAIITPDGTGITMILLFLPLIALYFLGSLGNKKYAKVAKIKNINNL
ncbi:MAG: twin-arginine translocase subunit TatC [Patescibacteria group bacterium]